MTSFLHEQRLDAVQAELAARKVTHILDLGCGTGDMLKRLVRNASVEAVVGVDISQDALEKLRSHLKDQPEAQAQKVKLICGSLFGDLPGLQAFDCAILIETIEHIAPENLSAVERAVFGSLRPKSVIVTTPNAEFNHLLGVRPGRFRHPGHTFEWDRARFGKWAEGVALRNGYSVICSDIAGRHASLGGASQMAVFDLPVAENGESRVA